MTPAFNQDRGTQLPEYRVPIRHPGTRGDELPDGRELIVCLGCSHTYGLSAISDSYPKQLEGFLGPSRWQVLNMGYPNYGLKLVLDWYWRYGSDLAPAYVILQLPLFCRQPLPGTQTGQRHFTMSEGAFALLRSGTVRQAAFVRACRRMMQQDTKRLCDFYSQLGDRTRLMVLIYEAGRSLANAYFHRYVRLYHDSVVQWAFGQHVPVVASPSLNARHFRRNGWLIDQSHPNAAGNAYIAKAVASMILEAGSSSAYPPRLIRTRMIVEPICLSVLATLAGLLPDKPQRGSATYPLW